MDMEMKTNASRAVCICTCADMVLVCLVWVT